MVKVPANYTMEQMQLAIKKKQTFYSFFKIRRPWRDFYYCNESAYCPLCERITSLVVVGMLNDKYKGEQWKRCESCLIKLPSGMSEKLLRFRDRNKISKFQSRLT